jgi:hypothetical protein
MKIKISPTIAYEYQVRGIFDCIGPAGVYDLDAKTITEIKEDAEFYTHPDGPDTTIGERSAYRGLLIQIAKLERRS